MHGRSALSGQVLPAFKQGMQQHQRSFFIRHSALCLSVYIAGDGRRHGGAHARGTAIKTIAAQNQITARRQYLFHKLIRFESEACPAPVAIKDKQRGNTRIGGIHHRTYITGITHGIKSKHLADDIGNTHKSFHGADPCSSRRLKRFHGGGQPHRTGIKRDRRQIHLAKTYTVPLAQLDFLEHIRDKGDCHVTETDPAAAPIGLHLLRLHPHPAICDSLRVVVHLSLMYIAHPFFEIQLRNQVGLAVMQIDGLRVQLGKG